MVFLQKVYRVFYHSILCDRQIQVKDRLDCLDLFLLFHFLYLNFLYLIHYFFYYLNFHFFLQFLYFQKYSFHLLLLHLILMMMIKNFYLIINFLDGFFHFVSFFLFQLNHLILYSFHHHYQ